MEINPVGSPTERYYGNLDVPDGGYVGNEDGLPLIIFDYAAEALQLGGSNILGAGNIEGTGLTIFGSCVLGLNSAVFQPTADSTTFFQVKDAAGASVLNLDSTNRQVTVGQTSATYPFLINSTDASDQILYYHDNTNPYFRWTDGNLQVITNKGTNTDTQIHIKGKGTGIGQYRVYDQDNLEYIQATCDAGAAKLKVAGSSPQSFKIQDSADVGVWLFSSSAEGETEQLRVYGRRTGDSIRHLQMQVSADDDDTFLFDNVGNYEFRDGTFVLANRIHSDADGGGATSLLWKRERSGGEEADVFSLTGSHDGAADDELGKIVASVNTGAGLVEALRIDSNKVVTIPGIGDGGLTNYDLKIGDTSTPDYGMIQIGNSVIGRTSYKAGNIDLDGTIMVRNIGGPVTSEVEFIWTESAGNTCRFALPKSAVGNATYNSRSMLLAGPAPADTDFVKVTYWQGQGIFDNLACDTAGDGADLGIQHDLEVEGDIFTDSIKESTAAAGVSIGDGGVTNYLQIAADGELTLAGTARVVKHVQAIDELGKGGSAPTVRTTEEPYVSYTYAVNNDSHITFEIPEDMDFTVACTIKLHWYTSVDQTDDEVNWEARWNSRAPGEVVNAGETIDTSGDINCPTQWVILESTIETVPANSCAAGDIFGLHLERVAIVDGTNPAATSIHALSVELEYTANKLGEAT